MRTLAVALVRAYQIVLSPLFAGSCKYHPSCSQYAIDAIRAYGVLRGSALAAWRLLRCNPWSQGGVDRPVWPPARPASDARSESL